MCDCPCCNKTEPISDSTGYSGQSIGYVDPGGVSETLADSPLQNYNVEVVASFSVIVGAYSFEDAADAARGIAKRTLDNNDRVENIDIDAFAVTRI